MNLSRPLATKHLSDGTTIEVYADLNEENPRYSRNNVFSTFHMWHGWHDLSDLDPPKPPGLLLGLRQVYAEHVPHINKLSDADAVQFMADNAYPGELLTVRIENENRRLVVTAHPFNPADQLACGYIYMSPQMIEESPTDDPVEHMHVELVEVNQFLNREIYRVEVSFADDTYDVFAGIYPGLFDGPEETGDWAGPECGADEELTAVAVWETQKAWPSKLVE